MPSRPPLADDPPSRTRSLPPSPAESVTVKGFYLRALVRELAEQGHHLLDLPTFRDFADYPQTLAQRLILECAQRLYPSERRNDGLRRVGWIIYPTLLTTMIGRVIFGSLGDDVPAVLRAAGRGFEVSLSEGRYEVLSLERRIALVRVRNFYLFPDSFLVGIFEGLFAHYGLADAKVTATLLGPYDADLRMEW